MRKGLGLVLIRCLAMLLMAALLSGMQCTPVHSDRPLGSRPYVGAAGDESVSASDLNGLWTLDIPDQNVPREFAPRRYLAWFQPELNRFVVLPSGRASTVGELDLRTHSVAGDTWFFFNEEDRHWKGLFLWALGKRVNVDTFLIWTTDSGRDKFQVLVERGQLPGTVVQEIEGKSDAELSKTSSGLSASGLPVIHSVLLQGLEARHLDFIVEHRAELFKMDALLVLRRVERFPVLKHPDVRAIRTPPASSAPASEP